MIYHEYIQMSPDQLDDFCVCFSQYCTFFWHNQQTGVNGNSKTIACTKKAM